MASEKVKLLGAIELEYSATTAGTLVISSDLPGNAIAQRGSPITIPASAGRRQVRFRVLGSVKGHLFQFQWSPGFGTGRLYRARVWARELPNGPWGWYPLPVPETPDEWSTLKLPIPVSPEEWSAVSLPIPVSPQEWSMVSLPIPGTPEEWSTIKLPVRPTPVVPDWIPVEIDQ
jgi:hypothetical protein